MKSARILLTLAATASLCAGLLQPAQARRGDDDRGRTGDFCTNAPRSQWLPMQDFGNKARNLGYAVVKIEISGSCYEVYGTKNGVLYELYFNPATGELLRTERDDRH
jgi:hypothetical protein